MKSKKFYLQIFGLFLLICIPLIIEYLINPRYITAGDALAFWGAIIGASVAIFGVYLTLNHSNKQTQQMHDENQKNLLIDRSMGVYPFIHLCYSKNFEGIPLEILEKEIGISNLVIIEYTKETVISSSMGYDAFGAEFSYEVFQFNKFELINSGIGAANEVFAKVTVSYNETERNKQETFVYRPILPNTALSIFICPDNRITSGHYKIELSYNDIYRNCYRSEFNFKKTDNQEMGYELYEGQKLWAISTIDRDFKDLFKEK